MRTEHLFPLLLLLLQENSPMDWDSAQMGTQSTVLSSLLCWNLIARSRDRCWNCIIIHYMSIPECTSQWFSRSSTDFTEDSFSFSIRNICGRLRAPCLLTKYLTYTTPQRNGLFGLMVSVHGHLTALLLVGMTQYQMTGACSRPGYPIASGVGQGMEGRKKRRKVGGVDIKPREKRNKK